MPICYNDMEYAYNTKMSLLYSTCIKEMKKKKAEKVAESLVFILPMSLIFLQNK